MRPKFNKFLFLSLLLSIFLLIVDSDLASDRTALLALRMAVGIRSLFWNISDQRPCNWSGVTCQANRVVGLRLPGLDLSGQLPLAIGNLTMLQTLSLRINALSGPVPAAIGNLVSLRHLYLEGNLFYGEIPEFLFDLHNLVTLNLANNNFSGFISLDFNQLTRLTTLCLEGNQLNGSIPDLNLGFLNQFNVSFNKLTGPIPERLSTKPASSFLGNSLCGKPLLLCNGTSIGDNSKLSGGAIAVIFIGSAIGFLSVIMILIFSFQRRSKLGGGVEGTEGPMHREVEILGENAMADEAGALAVSEDEFKSIGAKGMMLFKKIPEVFKVEDLLRESGEKLGEGSFGTTYKATIKITMAMAMKKLKNVNASELDFRKMIETVANVNHENLLPLVAYCFLEDEKLLVYDYMSKGSLSALLHGDRSDGRSPLNWDTRTGIALGVARAIAHLHSLDPAMSHGNIKSSNIFLTASFEVRVSEFGFAHVTKPTVASDYMYGYRAPEVTDSCNISQKADVYSFGVLLLELFTGKDPTGSQLKDEGMDLPRWILSALDDEWTSEIFELELLQHENVEEELLQLLQVAISCIAEDPNNRPSMAEVKFQIEKLRSSCSQVHETQIDVEGGNSRLASLPIPKTRIVYW